MPATFTLCDFWDCEPWIWTFNGFNLKTKALRSCTGLKLGYRSAFQHVSFVNLLVQQVIGAGHSKRDRVNCNLSHDKELFIRGLNWLVGQEDWREKFGGAGGGSCQRQGPVPDLWLYSNQNTSHNAPLLSSLIHIRMNKEKRSADASPNRKSHLLPWLPLLL